MTAAFWAGSPPQRRSSGDPGTGPVESGAGSSVDVETLPFRTSAIRFSPVGVSSSSPPAPCTTSACSVPSFESTSAIGTTSASE